MSEVPGGRKMHESDAVSAANRLGPPLTDPNYALAQATEWWLSRYENVIAQPILLVGDAAKRFREITGDDDGTP